jgi:hypothetical protein
MKKVINNVELSSDQSFESISLKGDKKVSFTK